ncbi:MAG: PQQ-dependent sugar dehydrogenase [Phenylobacterium sp.]
MTTRNRVLLAVALFAGLAAAFTGWSAEPAPQEEAARASIRFQQYCGSCHGPEARGGEAPALVGRPLTHGSDAASIVQSIRQGYPAKGMPPFAGVLSEGDIQGIAAFLTQRRTAAASPEGVGLDPATPQIPAGVVRTDLHDFRVEVVARMAEPYGLDFLPDGRILVTESQGRLRVIDHGRLLPDPVADLPPSGAVQSDHFKRKLADVRVHPDWRRNGWIYLTSPIDRKDANGQEQLIFRVIRGRIRDNRWVDSKVLLEFPAQGSNAARMRFGPDGFLYVSTPFTGNSYNGPLDTAPSQDLADLNGKILRMDDEGRPAPDNPFLGRAGANPYVWTYGHRVAMGLTFDARGELWESENGQRGGDELNHVRAGRNYGWPVITWGHRYDAKPEPSHVMRTGMEQPLVSWVPAIAVSSIAYYDGDRFPRWKGNIFAGSLQTHQLIRMRFDGDREVAREVVLHDIGRVRDVAGGPDGALYVLTEPGLLLRLTPAGAGRR